MPPAAPPNAAGATRELGFDLSIDPNPRFVSTVRRLVENAFQRLLQDPECVGRISMSAHELLENATRYAIGGKPLLRVSFRRDGEQAAVSLYLANETTPRHIGRLQQRVQAVVGAADPFAHYLRLMRDGARGGVDDWGLGLARIRAEAQMDVSLEVRGSSVALLATTLLSPESLRG